jgi:hypothetical protein
VLSCVHVTGQCEDSRPRIGFVLNFRLFTLLHIYYIEDNCVLQYDAV